MNKQRIQQCIEMMRDARSLDMGMFQYETFALAESIDELHSCGNTACFAGYLALSEPFKAAGGQSFHGEPVILHKGEKLSAEDAVAYYLDIDRELAEAIVYGDSDEYDELYPVRFKEVKPKHVIGVLQGILDGEYGGQSYE